jgi:predicted ATPase/DNA-binding winged helix-turn-helix (wHTH) protein
MILGVIELEPVRRRVTVRGKPVTLGARAFDVLHMLAQAGGAVVSRDALLHRVWSDVVVEEANLQVQIAALRKAFGDDRDLIETVARQGYRLMVERLMEATGTQATSGRPDPAPVPGSNNLPYPVHDIIGREAAIAEVIALLKTNRIVTLTGPGGIGKTRLALEVGHRALADFRHGVWLAELGALATAELVAGRVSDALGARTDLFASRFDAIAGYIGERELLLVLDNCEHVIEEVALLAQYVVRAVPNARILATSRELLGSSGETVYTVAPLQTAAEGNSPGRPPAAQLFLTRMRALTARIPVDTSALRTVNALCERLDGIPLAIEIAAAWAPSLGIDQLSRRLDDRIRLMADAHRTPVARHRTLGATLDWSFELLGEAEQRVLCSLAVFAGGFTLDAALALGPDDQPATATIAALSALVRKSLVLVDTDARGSRYRLLDITRAYLVTKLRARDAWDRIHARHARFFMRQLATVREGLSAERREGLLRGYRRELDNVRAALQWSLVEEHDVETGVNLGECAAAVMFDLSLLEECASVADRAQRECARVPGLAPRVRLSLLMLRAAAFAYTLGPTEAVAQAWRDVQRGAFELGETAVLVRATWGLWTQKWYAAEPLASLQVARDFIAIEGPDVLPYAETLTLLGARMTGIALHFAGDQREARRQLEYMIARYDHDEHVFPAIGTRFDHRRAARVTHTRVRWLLGEIGPAIDDTQRIVDDCEQDAPPLLQCYALLEGALPVMLMLRRWDDAARFSEQLQRRLAQHPVPVWQPCADCLADLAALRASCAADGLASLMENLERMERTHFVVHRSMIGCLLAEALGAAGEIEHGLDMADATIARCETTGEGWCLPELLRVRAELSIQQSRGALDRAEQALLRALALAREQGALFWELRLTKSLARICYETGRAEEARTRLSAIYAQFSADCEVADLIAVRVMLDALNR